MATRFIERMAIEVDGQGEPLVMIHGLGGTSNAFTPVIDGLARQLQVVRPDLPGAGRSPTSGRPSLEELADTIVRAVTALGIGRANFAGHSLGTIVCFHIALRNPRLVKSLALIGPLLAPADSARQGLRDRAAVARAQGMQPVADTLAQATTSAATRREQPVTVALIREMLMRQDAEGYARTCEALAEAAPPEVATVKCPVLLVAGDEDPIATATGARAIAARLSGARTRVLSRCGHWVMFERAKETAAALEEFFLQRR